MSIGTATYNFEGASVLVTGGTSGIGLACATGFAEAGAEVTITGTRDSASDYDLDLSAFNYAQLRVTNNEEIFALAESLEKLDVLVNNAGHSVMAEDDSPATRIAAFEEMVRVHLISGHNLAEACLDKLSASELAGGASIVGIASMTSYLSIAPVPGYGAGKAGMVQLTATQADMWAGRGIRSNCVAPGYISTRMSQILEQTEALSAPIIARTSMKRWGKPSEVADAVMFLSSDRASFITGETLVVDGGYLRNP